MGEHHHYAEALREQCFFEPTLSRFAVLGGKLVEERGFERDIEIFATNNIALALLVCREQREKREFDEVILWDRWLEREIPIHVSKRRAA